MLRDILNVFRSSERDLCAEEVAVRLECPMHSISAKLDHLEQMGYLRVYATRSSCEVCPLWSSCGETSRRQRVYKLMRKGPGAER